MAAKTDTIAAQKQAKQKKLLAVLGVVLIAVLAIQLPRLMGGDSGTTAEPAPGTDPAAVPAAATTPAPAGTYAASTPGAVAAPTGTGPSTSLAGVRVATAGAPKAGVAQLASFTLFEAKDPFVQQVVEESPTAPTTTGPTVEPGAATTDGAAAPSAGGDQPAPEQMTHATIRVNGDDEQLQVKSTFPADEPLFKLVSLKPKAAKVGIAGGALKDGQLATLKLGKKLTLVNTATGARYTLELVYVGTSPEQIEGFTPGEQPAATTTP